MEHPILASRLVYAVESADTHLNTSRLSLMRALEEINKYQRTFNDEVDPSRKADVLNWTINYLITGILPNLRIDLLANAQANLKSLAAIRENV